MTPPTRPSYGVDAPGIMAGLLTAGVGLIGTTAWLARRPGRNARHAALATGVAGGGAAMFGLAMLGYAIDGKARIRDLMLDAVAWQGAERVLDVGTGRGMMAIGAAKRLTTGRVTAIDIWQAKDLSANGMAGAMANAAIEDVVGRIDFRHQDATTLSPADGTFDVVLSLLCLHNIEPVAARQQACRAMARAVSPGGTIVIGDYVSTGPYAQILRSEGLTIDWTRWHLKEARGLMSITRASRPR